MEPLWHIELFGGLRAISGAQIVTRFRSHKTGALLAFLAFYSHRTHSRDLLLELLWPGEELTSARMKLRTALASLRRQLEPPGIPHGTVLLATRLTSRLNPASISTDVTGFEAALVRADSAADLEAQTRSLDEAFALYHGSLLPGYYEPWILPEQQRLTDWLGAALQRLAQQLAGAGDRTQALVYARRAVALDPLREEAQRALIRLYAADGQFAAARGQYQEFAQLLGKELGEGPSAATRALLPGPDEGDHRAAESGGLAGRVPGAKHWLPGAPPPAAESRPSGPTAPGPGTAAQASPSTAGELQIAGQPADLPPSRPLPLPPTRFFGREAELARIRQRLVGEGVRLLTLTGPGGSGKTRLALEAAARLREALAGTVWFVPLADLTDPQRLIDAIHAALGLPRRSAVAPEEQVVAAFAARPSLLVLDNLEHLLPGVAPLVRELLERAPLLQCLVTSRQVLELAPEREILVGPLPVPGVQELQSESRSAQDHRFAAVPLERVSALLANESVALFVDRAVRASPDFQLTTANAAAVVELCRRLEGIPLAIELAGARAQRLSPGRMVAELEQRFALLVSRKRDLPSRHQTLRAAIDWSFLLLPPELQQFFTHLFPFRGGFTVEAAAAVAEQAPLGLALVRERLHILHASSLVQIGRSGSEEGRFGLLEALREFAAEQLTADERMATARRHAEYYLAVAEAEASALLGGPRQDQALARLETEHNNLRTAIDWAQSSTNGEIGVRLALALERFWRLQGHLREARDRFAALLRLTGASGPTPARADLLLASGHIAACQGEYDAARSLCEQAVSIHRRLGDRRALATTLHDLGAAAGMQGDHPAAYGFGEESLVLSEAVEDRRGIAAALNHLGLTLVYLAQYDRARTMLQRSLLLNQERGDHLFVSFNLSNLGLVAVRQGCLDEAGLLFGHSLRLKRDLGLGLHQIAFTLAGMAELAVARCEFKQAIRLFAAVADMFAASEHSRCPPAERANDVRLLAVARVAVGAPAFEAAWSEGQTWALEQLIG